MESEMTPVQPPKKPFYKRPWGFIALVAAAPVVVVALVFAYMVGSYYLNYFSDASKLPPEARWLLEHMSEQQRIEDMVECREVSATALRGSPNSGGYLLLRPESDG